MAEQRGAALLDDGQSRRNRRAELLLERERAAARRRERGFRLRLPSSKPLVLGRKRARPTAG